MANIKINSDPVIPQPLTRRITRPEPPAQDTFVPSSSTPGDQLRLSQSQGTAKPQQTLNLTAEAPAQTKGHPRFKGNQEEYFAFLDKDPVLRNKAKTDAVGAMLDLLSREDVPLAVEKSYTRQAGSPGGGRILMLLDYTRGIPTDETSWQAVKKGPMHYLSSKIITPMLTHFREVDGASLFPGDATMTPAFRDSPMWGPKTNQVGHMLCALETGVRMGKLTHHGIERRGFDLGLKAGTAAMGFENIQGNAMDVSRAGIIGHEMIGDGDGGGFISQMKAYDKLVANGDPDQIRSHWDQAVDAVQRGDHQTAYTHIDAISKAIEAPSTPEEVAKNLANDHPRFAAPHKSREGNSREDIALSVYGFALGYQAMAKGLDSPAAARTLFESRFSAQGSEAEAINRAAGVTAPNKS